MRGVSFRTAGPAAGRTVGPAAGLLITLALAACEQGPLPPAGTELEPEGAPRQTLASALRQCTIDYEYDPEDAGGLAPDALGDGEVEWRDCAYQAFDRVLKPDLNEPEALDALIDEDRRLTGEIAAGAATRSDRSAAIGARLDVMQTHEVVLRQEEISEMSAGDLLSTLQSGTDEALDALAADLAVVREAL